MGGQACVLYGAAEFSRDTDLAILAEKDNLEKLKQALNELCAENIAVPPFESHYLEMGLAVHFRCRHPEAERIRIDIMSKMRGVDEFPQLWDRRTTVEIADGKLELLSLPDLVLAKKTQQEKDWPMIARLVEANYLRHRDSPSDEQISFWLKELRTPALIIEAAMTFPQQCQKLSTSRGLLSLTVTGNESVLESALQKEQQREREADRHYWKPLREKLEELRMQRRSS